MSYPITARAAGRLIRVCSVFATVISTQRRCVSLQATADGGVKIMQTLVFTVDAVCEPRANEEISHCATDKGLKRALIRIH